jgi:MFS family permease
VHEPSPGYLGLLRDNPAYRRLWLGEVVSFLGDWFSTIALYTVVQDLSGSARAVAAVMVAKTLPSFLVTPIAGPLIDRYDRRTVLIATDLLRAASVAVMIAAAVGRSLPWLYVAVVLSVACTGVFFPARSAAVPDLVDDRSVPAAMALSGGTWSVMLALGGALGGVAVAAVGSIGALGIDLLTFLVSAALLWGLPRLPPREEGDAGSAGLIEGLRYLRTRPDLIALLGLKPALGLAGAPVAMVALIGNGVFAATAGPLWMGLVFSGRGVGSILGSLGVRRMFGDDPGVMRALIGVGLAAVAVGYGVGGLATGIGGVTFAYLIAGVGVAVVWVFSGTLLQQGSARAYRGRLFSAEFGLTMVVMSAAGWIGGEAVDRGLTALDVLWWTGGVMALPTALWAVAFMRGWAIAPAATPGDDVG